MLQQELTCNLICEFCWEFVCKFVCELLGELLWDFLCFFFLESEADMPLIWLGDGSPFTLSFGKPFHFFMCLLSFCPDVKTTSRHFQHP